MLPRFGTRAMVRDLVLPLCLGTLGRLFIQRLVRLFTGFALGFCLGFLTPLLPAETAIGVSGLISSPADSNKASPSPGAPALQAANLARSMTVLILGDSLSLCGFGKSLDKRFRKDSQVKATFTYMACGTVPVSWLKQKPFTNAKTFCGLWSIESVPGAAKPKEFLDSYGEKAGYRPKPHPVPKLEDLLSTLHPDILVMQTGNNLFSLFRDGKTVLPSRHGPILKSLIAPFISEALKGPLQKIYWVASPTSGRISKEVQDFVVEQVRALATPVVKVIDSRQLVTYPYRHMSADREHFFGEQTDEWAGSVFNIITQDLASGPASAPKSATDASNGQAEPLNPSDTETHDLLSVSGTLVFKSQPLRIDQLLPYQESLVAYIYDVREILQGDYKEKQVLVMHPAHVGLTLQPLEKYEIGKSYELHLRELEGTLWATVKSQDDSGRIDLPPYIQVEDENRFPAQNH
jgi:hypothetical protein